ncbi:MAG TPA: S41 family peptidase [Desulfomonilaceae bacterium]|nr:S41 family peptidase [Desulfomonilaceae bacterium]
MSRAWGTYILTVVLVIGGTGVKTCYGQQDKPDYKEFKRFYGIMKIVQKNYVRATSDKDLVDGAIFGMLNGLGLERSWIPADVFAPGEGESYDLKRFWRAHQIVEKKCARAVTEKEIINYACSGMIQSLDPHSSFMTEEIKELQVEAREESGALGIEITLKNGVLTIVSPIEDSPAFKAGLKPDDKIIKIDGESTKNITLLKAIRMMRGPRGSKANLTVMREGFDGLKDFTLTREIIHVFSVRKQLIEPGYAYIKIVNFQESTDAYLTKAIQELGDEASIKGIILDLRGNPGGLLDQAVRVTNMFIEEGLIVYTDGRARDQRMEFRANPQGKHYQFKMAMLINEGSAAASEIVAGALQDHDRSLIFGTKSFGKASIQTIIPLGDESGIRLTTAYYYTPKGRYIEKTGIIPDIEVKEQVQGESPSQGNPDPETDVVLKRALEWLKSAKGVSEAKLQR